MKRTVNILIALTAVAVFSYLIFFLALSISGSGGEYWGYSANVEPVDAAVESFEKGNFVMLAIKMTDIFGETIEREPDLEMCGSQTGAPQLSRFENTIDPRDGIGSVMKAKKFMKAYNRKMSDLLKTTYGDACDGDTR